MSHLERQLAATISTHAAAGCLYDLGVPSIKQRALFCVLLDRRLLVAHYEAALEVLKLERASYDN